MRWRLHRFERRRRRSLKISPPPGRAAPAQPCVPIAARCCSSVSPEPRRPPLPVLDPPETRASSLCQAYALSSPNSTEPMLSVIAVDQSEPCPAITDHAAPPCPCAAASAVPSPLCPCPAKLSPPSPARAGLRMRRKMRRIEERA